MIHAKMLSERETAGICLRRVAGNDHVEWHAVMKGFVGTADVCLTIFPHRGDHPPPKPSSSSSSTQAGSQVLMCGHSLHYLLVYFSLPLVRCVLCVAYNALCAMSGLTFVVWQSDTGCLLCAVPGVGCGRRAGAGDVPEGHAQVGRGQ